MAGIFERIGDIIKANINDMIDRAEDPEKMVKQIIIDMEAQVEEATRALGQAMASEKQAKKQLDVAQASSADWEQKAKVALQAGNQDLARRALESKVGVDKSLVGLQESYDIISTQVATLRDQISALRAKLDEARSRQNVLIARSKMAEAQQKAATSISSVDSSSAFSKLDKMEKRVEEKEALAGAFTEMAGVTAADEYQKLETSAAVEAEMARLMAELGGNK